MLTETTKYINLLKRPEWLSKRQQILKRDGMKCVNCSSQNSLHVHHKQYHGNKLTGDKKLPWAYDDKYLVTLCEKCHAIGHAKYKIPFFNL